MITENCWNCLYIIFLGGARAKGFQFMTPRPMHHACWMLKVIYNLTVWISQFKVTSKEKKGLRQAIFTIRVYIKARLTVPLEVSDPNNDLLLLRFLLRYEDVNQAISKAAITKLAGHLCYLSEDLIGLVFLDKNVPAVVKRHMVLA